MTTTAQAIVIIGGRGGFNPAKVSPYRIFPLFLLSLWVDSYATLSRAFDPIMRHNHRFIACVSASLLLKGLRLLSLGAPSLRDERLDREGDACLFVSGLEC